MEKICIRLLAVCSLILGTLLVPPTAQAAVTSARPSPHVLDGVGRGQVFTYDTTTDDGRPIQASATLYEPNTPWRGKGERPTIIFAPGPRGAGDQCAPSRAGMGLGSVGLSKAGSPTINANYEYGFYMGALQHGAQVIVADLIGLGMPGHHTYVNHIEEAHAMLDAARSGLELAHAPKDAPIGFAGYSQGGGASLAAAEFADSYAPELNVAGTYSGAPPADLPKVMKAIDRSSIVHVLGYAINGFAERDPKFRDAVLEELNPRGIDFLRSAATSCTGDSILMWGFSNTRQLTRTGESLSDLVERKPIIKKALLRQNLGKHALKGPALIASSPHDDLIPHEQVRSTAGAYCQMGGTVDFMAAPGTATIPGAGADHALPLYINVPVGLKYLFDRFDGKPAPSNCAG